MSNLHAGRANRQYTNMIGPIPLTNLDMLTEINDTTKPRHNGVLLFKHSPRCIVSKMVLREFMNDWDFDKNEIEIFLVDVINQRELSNKIADIYDVRHESPQMLHIKENVCSNNASHASVSVKKIESWLYG